MDVRTGEIISEDEFLKLPKEEQRFFRDMANLPPTDKQLRRNPPKVGRNEPCPCGSGKKFKHCCLLH